MFNESAFFNRATPFVRWIEGFEPCRNEMVFERSSPSCYSSEPFTALASYQIGCSSQGYGAFFFPGSPTASLFATVQAVPAMAGKKLPIGTSTKSVTIPLKAC